MRSGFLLHPHHQPPPPSSVMVTWSAGSWWWVCPIACGFIHNYSRYLEPKLKHADGPGWTGVSRQVSPISVRVSPGPVPSSGVATCYYLLLCKMRDGRHGSTSGIAAGLEFAVRGGRVIAGGATAGSLRAAGLLKCSVQIHSPQGASGRRENVGQPRSA